MRKKKERVKRKESTGKNGRIVEKNSGRRYVKLRNEARKGRGKTIIERSKDQKRALHKYKSLGIGILALVNSFSTGSFNLLNGLTLNTLPNKE
ncbi:hypothetical protein J7L06_07135 [Candidatus Bathyarchaeota archaeon]|nr:hypothetical protein [Candidatus Bathyarchaeota archaeon]